MMGPFGVSPLLLVAVAVLAACGSSVRTSVPAGSPDIPANYPTTVVESPEHRQAMRDEWERLFEAYRVPPERRKAPELEPFTHTPKSILGAGPIQLVTEPGAPAPDEERVRLLVRDFIAKHPELLGVAANTLSLENVAGAGAIGKRYEFVQTQFPHPIAPPWGRLDVVVTPAGEIVQISDTAIPVAVIPSAPRITREAAEKKVVGMTFTYGDIAGRPQTVTVSDPAAVSAKRLVVYPEQTEAALRIRLAWEVEAGSGMMWSVFVDAITGEVVGTRQNFQT